MVIKHTLATYAYLALVMADSECAGSAAFKIPHQKSTIQNLQVSPASIPFYSVSNLRDLLSEKAEDGYSFFTAMQDFLEKL